MTTEDRELPAPPPIGKSSTRTGFPIGLTVATAIAMAILLGLGVWQLQRLKWKQALLAHVAQAQAAQPQPIEPVLDALANGHDVDFTRVRVTCRGLAQAPAVELYSLRQEIGRASCRERVCQYV